MSLPKHGAAKATQKQSWSCKAREKSEYIILFVLSLDRRKLPRQGSRRLEA